MKRKSLLKKAGKTVRRLGKDFSKTPLARASRGKHTKGYF